MEVVSVENEEIETLETTTIETGTQMETNVTEKSKSARKDKPKKQI